jgi:peptidoglycan hydrolase-like protein with peptidoglycan-binding domain
MPVKHPNFLHCPQLINASNNNPPLKKGAKGEGVRLIQKAMIQLLGIDMPKSTLPDGTLDGDYGAETKNAVIAFQLLHELDDDGRVGMNTLAKIEEELFKNKPKPAKPVTPPPPPITNIPALITGALNFPWVDVAGYKMAGSRFFHFSVDGCLLEPYFFPIIASYFNKNRIRTRHAPDHEYAGEYDSEGNVLILRSLGSDPTNLSLIVHECVHAHLDRVRASLVTVAHSEAIAYVAQCLYFKLFSKTGKELHGEGDMAPVFDAANAIANEINVHHATRFMEGKKDAPYRATNQEAQALLQALNKSERYKNSLKILGGFNGIPNEIGEWD